MTDWIKWNGGPCPVPPETLVQARFGTEEWMEDEEPCEADCYLWEHEPQAVEGDYHLTAYRIVKED